MIFIAISIISLILLIPFRHDIRAWNDFNVYLISTDYFEYKEKGGKFKREYSEAINMDKFRNEIASEKSLSELLSKYPDSRTASSYDIDSYRRNAAKHYIKTNKDELIYLDNNFKDGAGWAIFIKNGVGHEIVLIKG